MRTSKTRLNELTKKASKEMAAPAKKNAKPVKKSPLKKSAHTAARSQRKVASAESRIH